MTNWATLGSRQLGDLMKFLCSREQYCVSFTERLIRNGRAVLPPSADVNVVLRRDGEGPVDGAILQVRSGLYYPVLGDARTSIEADAMDLLRRKSRRVYSVIGRQQDVTALELAFGRSPRQAVEYHLMVQDSPPPDIPLSRLPERLEIHRSQPPDAERLSGLQREYEIEEVLLPGNDFDPVGSLRHLRAALKQQVVVHGVVDGRPIAKAGTNARGAFYDQIGGVYTDPRYRSRGVATALMLRLLSLIAGQRKSASLFVKMDNGPALTLYQNLGFRVVDGFRISYYR